MTMQMCELWHYFKYQQIYFKPNLGEGGAPFCEYNGV